jgi:uncharacterized membrane protein YdjX (TVP38/TMEM64 family)
MFISELIEITSQWQASGILSLGLLGAAFICGNFIPIPRHPLCILGGLTFGFYAFFFALVTCTAGAVLAFLLSRYLLRRRFLDAIGKRRVWNAILKAIDDEGCRIVILLRLGSPIPGPVNNYLFGLTKIGLWPYCFATAAGLLPTIFVFTYIGIAGKAAVESTHSATELVIMIVGLLIFSVVIFLVMKRARKLLAMRTTF